VVEHADFKEKVKAYVSRAIDAILKGMRTGKISLDIDIALSILRVALVGQ